MTLRSKSCSVALASLLLVVPAALVSGCGEMPPGACRDYEGGIALSPDERTLAVAASEPKGLQVFLVDLDSGSVQALTDSHCDSFPAWSPDGRKVAVLDQDSEIYIVDRASGARHVVHGSFYAANSLAWTSPGAFVYGEENGHGLGGETTYEVATLPTTGADDPSLPFKHARYPTLSPDGRQIAYLSDNTNDLYIANYPEGIPRLTFHDDDDMYTLAWAPDGRRIAFAADDGVHLLDVRNRREWLLKDTSWSISLVWRHDSRHLLYTNDELVREINVATGSNRTVVELSTLHDKAKPPPG
jgi:Tol biopolymer transport system component